MITLLLRFVIKRLIILIPVIIGISIMLFWIATMMPGDPVALMLPPTLRPDQYQAAYDAMYLRLGMDRSIVEQYFIWIYEMFQGNLGYSSLLAGRPVVDVIAEPMRNTIILNVFVIIFHLLLALPIGIRMAVKRGSLYDNFWQVFSLATFSQPPFFISLILIFIFAINLGWLPIGGMPNAALLDGADYFIAWARHLRPHRHSFCQSLQGRAQLGITLCLTASRF